MNPFSVALPSRCWPSVRRAIVVIAFALSSSCCVTAYRPDFAFEVSAIQGEASPDVVFDWSVTRSDMKVAVHNGTATPITIDWPSAKFIDFAGSSHGFGPRKEPEAIGAGQKSAEVVYPNDFEYAHIGRSVVRSFEPHLRTISSADRSVAEDFGKAHVGDEAKIVLPVIVRGVRRTYIFSVRTTTFTIKRLCVS